MSDNDAASQQQTKLVDVVIRNQNDALQLLILFINAAQKRGVFAIDESAKIWECIRCFQQQPQQQQQQQNNAAATSSDAP
jgi:hypothetical protein